MAAERYREVAAHLAAAHPSPTSPEEIASVAVAYVRFALDHPAPFRAMFAEPCDPDNEERVAATATIAAYVRDIARRTFPEADPEASWTSVWTLVHGLAFLHLDGTFDAATPEAVAEQIRTAVLTLLTAAPAWRSRRPQSNPGGERRPSPHPERNVRPLARAPRDINSWTQGGTSEGSCW